MERQPKWEDKEAKTMREQNRCPGIIESSNLTDAEFKTQVIKMLNERMGSVDEFSENSTEIKKKHKNGNGIIKGNQSEMKNTLFEVRGMLNGINKVNREEDHMTYIEDEKVKDTQSEWQ